MTPNEQTFSKQEVEAGLLRDFIDCLVQNTMKSPDHYNEILITTDGCTHIVKWVQKWYDEDINEGIGFKFVDYDQDVVVDVEFPDRHHEWAYSREEGKEMVQRFLEEHQGEWARNDYGVWYNVKEQEELRKELYATHSHSEASQD